MRLAVSYDGNSIEPPLVLKTPETVVEGIKVLADAAREAGGNRKLDLAVCGIAGIFNRERTALFHSPNLAGWVGYPLKEEMEKTFGVETTLENDAALAGLGEAMFGAGRGKEIVVYITVSTGVGGARVVRGKIDDRIFGFEPGQQIISDGQNLEALVSGTAIRKRFSKKPAEMDDAKILNGLARELAIGLYNSILHWSPDIVVLGGAVINGVNPIPLERINVHLRELPQVFPELPVIKRSELGEMSALYGGLALAHQHTHELGNLHSEIHT